MNNHQYAWLMYGPKIGKDIMVWVKKFNLIDKKLWVKNFMLNEKHTYIDPYDSDDEEGIHIVFQQEFDECDYFYLLQYFLDQHSMCFTNIYEPSIGMKVEEYTDFTQGQKQKVDEFCKKYDLPKPTFYAGLSP